MKNLIINKYSKEKLAFFKQENNPSVVLDKLTTGSRKDIVWTCINGHNFNKQIRDFSKPTGTSCPTCRKKGNTVYDSELKSELSPNNTINPKDIFIGDNRTKLIWECTQCKYEYEASPWQRDKKKTACPKCSNKRSQSRNEIRIFSELSSIFNNVEENFILEGYKYDVYVKDINLLIEYDGYHWHSKYKTIKNDLLKNQIASDNNFDILRIREQGLNKINDNDIILNFNCDTYRDNESQINILNLLIDYINNNYNKTISKYENYFLNDSLYNEKLSQGFVKNDLTNHPKFSEYDEEKTGINPRAISCGSRQMVYWKCDKGHDHSWQDTPNNRKTRNCPFCSNHRVSITNRLDKIHPNSIKLWSNKNKNKPNDYTHRNGKEEIIWNCSSCHNEFTKTIARMDDSQGYCPHCKTKHFINKLEYF